ncbi:alkaline phosphatase family protein [Flavobacteriaceae bacterium]|jgi:predicted AlkP superfamily pyrophosphatase or phosphodiesterase|nr:alkaline phosphatase family protein [Flavobacteriaceae bacterium]
MSNKTFLNILIAGFFLLVIGFFIRVFSEGFKSDKNLSNNPKLVVGIVVDQMKYQYLTKYWDHYSEKGFKRLINQGFNAKSNHYGYSQTSTGPGHTTVATGTYPRVHGIIGNSWFDRKSKKSVYCVDDDQYETIGSSTKSGRKSPSKLLTTTLSDENRIATNFKGKTIGVAIKDRGSILSSGHTANAAYWFDSKEGSFISSTYYLKELPGWAKKFNETRVVDSYLKPWETYYDISTYTESGPDDNNYETNFRGEDRPVFPHNFKTKNKKTGKPFYGDLTSTPFGNSLVTDFSLQALESEKLGEDDMTDFLLIDYSSTDYVGHQFGTNSKEVQDTYIRLDKEIERLLNYFDKNIGKDEYTLFLSADHGVTNVPGFLKDNKIPVNYFNSNKWKKYIDDYIINLFGTSKIIMDISNQQIFLDSELISDLKLDFDLVKEKLINKMQAYPGIDEVYSSEQILNIKNDHFITLIRNGFNKNLSGDIIYTMMPNWTYYRKGSTHGTRFNHDTHVPLLLYGNGIKKGSTNRKTDVIDIAPTIASVLGINSPNASTGKVIFEAIDD